MSVEEEQEKKSKLFVVIMEKIIVCTKISEYCSLARESVLTMVVVYEYHVNKYDGETASGCCSWAARIPC